MLEIHGYKATNMNIVIIQSTTHNTTGLFQPLTNNYCGVLRPQIQNTQSAKQESMRIKLIY